MSTLSTLLSSLIPKPIPQTRPKAMGLNSNVSVQGTQYHIQTEDLWPVGAQFVTHVFAENGRVVRVFRVDYTRHLDKPHLTQLLPKVMSVYHGSVISKIARGETHEGGPQNLSESTAERAAPESFESTPEKSNVRASEPSTENLTAEFQPEQESGTFRVAASTIWDHLVEEAHRCRQAPEPEDALESRTSGNADGKQLRAAKPISKEASNRWALAVQASRQNPGVTTEFDAQPVATLPDSALDAHEMGLEQLRRGDKLLALVCLARAVELEPRNSRYRVSLRRALDWF